MTQKTKKLWQLVLLLAVDLILLILISVLSEAVCLGGSGERVAEIQKKIKEYGFYDGEISGIFDFETRNGIAEFQAENGIKKTGEADYKTVRCMKIRSDYDCFDSRTELLARCIQQSNCISYPEMLSEGKRILRLTGGAVTLGKYISINYPDFLNHKNEPSSDAYSAAINAVRSYG